MGKSAYRIMDPLTIVILGSGNVASHLAVALDQHYNVAQIFSRDFSNAQLLASKLKNCRYTDNLNMLLCDADFYLISVSDDAIREIISDIPQVSGIVAHTSGSVDIGVLGDIGSAQGVFYPLQTFSKKTPLDISKVPFFIEGTDSQSAYELKNIAKSLSDYVYTADSAQRQSLHLAAVFACNFFNHMLVIASKILEAEGYDINVLEPLIEVTLRKAMSVPPLKVQTGPAVRHDMSTIKKHLDRLNSFDKDIYSIITEAIIYEAQNSI